ncbi:MAG: leucyl aminopeptidase [Acidobacteriia bacterium]|jgi:leucyl aminopeptidase|nr:leucyl aminopeptidase [Terriglobia bacterium]
MDIVLRSEPFATVEAEALITYVFEQDQPIRGVLAELDSLLGGRLQRMVEVGELRGKLYEMTLLHEPPGLAARRLLVVGAGKTEKFTGAELRRLAAAAVRYLKGRALSRLAFLAREEQRDAAAAQAVTEGLLLGDFEMDKYKTEKKDGSKAVESVALVGWPEAVHAAVVRGRVIAESQNFARELINEPSNRLTPRILAERAAALAAEEGLECDILDEKKIASLRMGGLLAVSQGSAEPPRLIVLRYRPANPRPGAPVLGLVGKAVTFDTGGISIKPSEGMEKMKYDMAGGATVIAVMRAVARLKPPIEVLCVVPATENMPGGRAQKPGDVYIAMSGKSVEVINTDAEGRLILADGLTYARQLGATHLVDAATLTGAIVVALANVNVGVFGTDDAFTQQLLDCAKVAGEKMWRMPLGDEYAEMIRSTIADIQNVGSGKGGGAITAAMFLREFVESEPWIHLDIAGTAWLDEAKPWSAKGATGVGLRTLVELTHRL